MLVRRPLRQSSANLRRATSHAARVGNDATEVSCSEDVTIPCSIRCSTIGSWRLFGSGAIRYQVSASAGETASTVARIASTIPFMKRPPLQSIGDDQLEAEVLFYTWTRVEIHGGNAGPRCYTHLHVRSGAAT